MLSAAINKLELDAKIVTINGKLEGVESVLDILEDESAILKNLRYPCVDLNPEATAAVLLSSGTTGNPKGIIISNEKFLEDPLEFEVSPNDVIFCFSTICWITVNIYLYNSLLNGITRIITESSFTLDNFCYLIEKYNVTITFLRTESAARLSKCNRNDVTKYLKSIKFLKTGGSKVHDFVAKNLQSFLNEHARLLIGYGSSESGAVSSGIALERLNSEGTLMPNIEARIIDQARGKPLGPNEQGHLHLRSPYKWSGYYNDEAATKKVYCNGWINTQDLAYFDDQGYLFILGRDSDIFKADSFFVNPSQIENIIHQLPGAAEVCIFGKPNIETNHLISCAIIRANNDAGRKLSENDVVEHVKNNIMDMYNIKGGVYFVDSLPRNSTGKILRRKVWNEIKDCF